MRTTVQSRLHNAALQLFAERGVSAVSVSDLAQAAQVARGTIYNNFQSIDTLFEDVATELTLEMEQRVHAELAGKTDPAIRLVHGLCLCLRRVHEEPVWGRFLLRFGMTTPNLRRILAGDFADYLKRGIQSGRFMLAPEQMESVITMITGVFFASIPMVLEGYHTWRAAGSGMAELLLRALGLPADETQALSRIELPPLYPNPPIKNKRALGK